MRCMLLDPKDDVYLIEIMRSLTRRGQPGCDVVRGLKHHGYSQICRYATIRVAGTRMKVGREKKESKDRKEERKTNPQSVTVA